MARKSDGAIEPSSRRSRKPASSNGSRKKVPAKRTPQKDSKKRASKTIFEPEFKDKSNNKRIIIAIALIVCLTADCIYFWNDSVSIGANALSKMYNLAYQSEKDNAYQRLYQKAFDRAEKQYHVSNTVIISIGNLEKTEKLEVLKANDVEFITEDSDKNSGNVTAWLEVTGQGTFVVDLKAAEFIINNENKNVMVRVPYPELTNITITNAERKLFKDDIFNGSYSEGVELAIKQRNEASLQIQKSLMANQYIYSNAQDVAKSMITNLVKQFNPDIPELTVDVEFIE